MESSDFDYRSAFDRNIGWITECELQQLRTKKVAIAGMGGVGGIYLLTLIRMGVENFNIADFDIFEIQNFNRQIGATISNLNCPKVDALAKMARDINPDVKLNIFKSGVTENNLDEFLKDVDIYVDGLDFFVLDIRAKVFKRCQQLNIPAITAAPMGMSAVYFVFMPDKMSFEDYFRFEGLPESERQINFLLGFMPKLYTRKYLVDPTTTDFNKKRGPSTMMACELCAGAVGCEAIKVLLKRGEIYPVPYYHVFDAYMGKFSIGRIPWGNRNPIQRLKRIILKKILAKGKATKPSAFSLSSPQRVIEKIIDLSRWAPSPENVQPWKFEIKNDNHLLIHVENLSVGNQQSFMDILTVITCGILLETMRIVASHYSYACEWTCQKQSERDYLLDVKFNVDNNILADPLFPFVVYRSVDRWNYRSTPLSEREKLSLVAAVGDEFELHWYETPKDKWEIAKINAEATIIRLKTPENLEWNLNALDLKNKYSEDRIPIAATRMDFLAKRLLQWAAKTHARFNSVVNYLGGAYLSGFELDFIPGLNCGAHFVLLPKHDATTYPELEVLLRAGAAAQRFWLTATRLGLVMQPSFAGIVFSYYANHDIEFTQAKALIKKNKKLANKMQRFYGAKNLLFAGRIGLPVSSELKPRSIRKPLDKLLKSKS